MNSHDSLAETEQVGGVPSLPAIALRSYPSMPYSFFAVLNVLPQIALAAVLPIAGIAVVSYLIKATRPRIAESQ